MTESFEATAEIYKSLADRTRLHMLALLSNRELCVCEFVPILGLSQPAVSQHLRRLKHAGLVKERKTARWVFYSLQESGFPLLQDIVHQLPDVSEDLARLEALGQRVQCNL